MVFAWGMAFDILRGGGGTGMHLIKAVSQCRDHPACGRWGKGRGENMHGGWRGGTCAHLTKLAFQQRMRRVNGGVCGALACHAKKSSGAWHVCIGGRGCSCAHLIKVVVQR